MMDGVSAERSTDKKVKVAHYIWDEMGTLVIIWDRNKWDLGGAVVKGIMISVIHGHGGQWMKGVILQTKQRNKRCVLWEVRERRLTAVWL